MNRITKDENICGGKPCVTGTRIAVSVILGLFAGGYNLSQVLATHPQLSAKDVSAALHYAGDRVDEAARSGGNPRPDSLTFFGENGPT